LEKENTTLLFQKLQSKYCELLDAYKNILDIVNKEKEFIKDEKFDKLNEILNSKAEEIKKIEIINMNKDKIEKEICSIFNARKMIFDDYKDHISNALFDNIKEVRGQLETLISKIAEIQNENHDILAKDFEVLKNDIGKLKTDKKVLNSYADTFGQYESRFIDKSY